MRWEQFQEVVDVGTITAFSSGVTVSKNRPIMANHFERVGRKVTGLSLP